MGTMHRPLTRFLGISVLACCLLGLSIGAAAPYAVQARPTVLSAHGLSASGAARLRADVARLPLRFEANQGQSDGRVRFLAHGPGYTLFLTGDAAVLALNAARNPTQTGAH